MRMLNQSIMRKTHFLKRNYVKGIFRKKKITSVRTKKEIKMGENSSTGDAALIRPKKMKNTQNILLHKFGENYK